MFLIRKPSDEVIRAFLTARQGLPFSYDEVGRTREGRPPGYDHDHNRVRLGDGEAAFRAGCAALRRWEMFNLGWVRLCWPDAPIVTGTTVGVLSCTLGLWALNPCRIAYAIDETGAVDRFGFAYGTLAGHVEKGEERFSVEWHHEDDSVWYDLLAFSRPNHFVTRLGYPYTRRCQRRFARESLAVMAAAVRKAGG